MRVGIWTYMKWAFGRVHTAIQTHSKHDVQLFDWRNKNLEDINLCDIIHIPTIQCHQIFVDRNPHLKEKSFCSIRGKAELWNYNPRTKKRQEVDPSELYTNNLSEDVIQYINDIGKVACVSLELVELIKNKTKAKVYHVPCGADPILFSIKEKPPKDKLVVLCPIPKNEIEKSEHGYNVKRWNLVKILEKNLPNINFLFLKNRISSEDMSNFYKKGDIILCLSHSEGNPLGIIEAGMMGLLPVTTRVGAVSDIFTHNENAIIFNSNNSDEVIKKCIYYLKELNLNRDKLKTMQKNVSTHLRETRTWDKVVPKWDEFFESCNKIKKTKRTKMKKFKFHLLGLAHLPTSKEYNACAFTQKNIKLSKMLLDKGHKVIIYGAKTKAGQQPECSEFVETHTIDDIANDYGDGNCNFEIGYDWKSGEFRNDINVQKKLSTLKYYQNCIKEIQKRKKEDDFLLITLGVYQKPISQACNLILTCEPGIGYRGSYCQYRAFESSYIQNFTYGSENPFKSINGNYYDRVIPNYFDEEDVEYGEGLGEYYLYIGRMIFRKGVTIAAKVCEHLNKKLILVGQGGKIDKNGIFRGEGFSLSPGNWEYLGYADFEKRKKIFSNAIATFVPTIYLEPFAGTHIESMLSGTPVITSNFGVFPGTVINGINGFRCDVLQDYVNAAINCKKLNRKKVRKTAEQYLSKNVANLYEKWFKELYHLYESKKNPKLQAWNRLK
jgi:glycosyltransferase involved in cell wall biosynthesis